MSNEMTTDEPNALAILLSDPERLERLDVDKAERMFRIHAEALFNKAMNEVQTEMKPVYKGDHGHHGKYASMERIANMIQPIYLKHGFSVSSYCAVSDKPDTVLVVMKIMHTGGHTSMHEMEAPSDYISGQKGKTKLQGVGSTETYLKRRLLTSSFGIMLTDKLEDTDGEIVVDNSTISKDQTMELAELVTKSGADKDKFLKFFNASKISDIPASRFNEAKSMLLAKMK